MGLTVPVLPVKWGPRAILKLREVNRSDFEKFEVKLLILRADVDTDWDDLDKSIWHMVRTGMTTPYTAFAQQNGGPAGDTSVIKAADMKGVDGGGPGGGGGSPPNAAQQALQALHQSAQHANGVVDQQNATVS